MKISEAMLVKSYQTLIERAKPDADFVLLTAFAAAICTFGFKMNSPAVIVGAMVISPLLYAVVSLGAASFWRDAKSFLGGVGAFTAGLLIAVVVAFILAKLTPHAYSMDSEIIGRLAAAPQDYFLVALFSGLAGTFAYFWPGIIEAIAGIAISVALLPPVVMLGIGFAIQDSHLTAASGMIVLLNVLGIYLGSLLAVAGLYWLSEK